MKTIAELVEYCKRNRQAKFVVIPVHSSYAENPFNTSARVPIVEPTFLRLEVRNPFYTGIK